MADTLKPKEKSIADIFKQVDYGIDFYQREYKWSDKDSHKPVSSLLEDIFYRFELEYKDDSDPTPENITTFEWYYLNTYITNENKGKIYIVDGQQRLTTLTLIHIALYHLAKEYKLPEHLINTLKSSIYDSTDYGTSYCMGINDRKDSMESLFNKGIEGVKSDGFKNVSEKNIYENYKVITSILNEKLVTKDNLTATTHKLHFFTLYFRQRIKLIEIEITKSKDVHMVFEVINNRGFPLKPYEIFKGSLLGQITKNDLDKYLKIWNEQTKKLAEYNENKLDEFFSYYFRSKSIENSKQYDNLGFEKYHKSIFTEIFNNKFKLKHNEKEVKDFITSKFLYFSNEYLFTLEKTIDYDFKFKHIYFNNLNGQNGQFPLILSALTLDDAQNQKKQEIIGKLYDRNFVILNLTQSYDSNKFNESMISLLQMIREKNIEQIKEAFDNELLRLIGDSKNDKSIKESFKYEFFRNVGYEQLNVKFLRYFFARIEHYIAKNANLAVKDYYQLVSHGRGNNAHHIEHILANDEKRENLVLFENEEDFRIQRNRLGGLVLLKGPVNESSNNELYQDKLRTYSGSGYWFAETLTENFYKSNPEFKKFIEREQLNFQSFNTFGKDEIESRHRLLFEIVKKIWEI